jgi:hypothetical protein
VISPGRSRSVNAGPQRIAARRLIGALMAFVGTLATTGCYAFIPTTSTSLAETTPVTVSLTTAGSVALQSTLGAGVNEVEGTVVRSTSDSLVVAVENMYTTGRQKFASSGSTTSLPRGYINDVKVRTFSRKRTVLMVVGGVTVAALAGAAAGGGVFSGGDNGGGGNPPASIGRP